jgi:hypothetical protein
MKLAEQHHLTFHRADSTMRANLASLITPALFDGMARSMKDAFPGSDFVTAPMDEEEAALIAISEPSVYTHYFISTNQYAVTNSLFVAYVVEAVAAATTAVAAIEVEGEDTLKAAEVSELEQAVLDLLTPDYLLTISSAVHQQLSARSH